MIDSKTCHHTSRFFSKETNYFKLKLTDNYSCFIRFAKNKVIVEDGCFDTKLPEKLEDEVSTFFMSKENE